MPLSKTRSDRQYQNSIKTLPWHFSTLLRIVKAPDILLAEFFSDGFEQPAARPSPAPCFHG
jgi:hypothetical protein